MDKIMKLQHFSMQQAIAKDVSATHTVFGRAKYYAMCAILQ
jgi:hypothetical protein